MQLGSQLGPQSWQIHPSIQTRSRELEVYLHPHFVPQRIPMGNHWMEQCHPQISTTLPIMLEVAIVETRRQPVEVIVT
jgi:hypothetical protein